MNMALSLPQYRVIPLNAVVIEQAQFLPPAPPFELAYLGDLLKDDPGRTVEKVTAYILELDDTVSKLKRSIDEL